jgi:hypothetical protein
MVHSKMQVFMIESASDQCVAAGRRGFSDGGNLRRLNRLQASKEPCAHCLRLQLAIVKKRVAQNRNVTIFNITAIVLPELRLARG